jgi:hypothetical protein
VLLAVEGESMLMGKVVISLAAVAAITAASTSGANARGGMGMGAWDTEEGDAEVWEAAWDMP